MPLVVANSAQAIIAVSTAPTSHISCSAGVCTPTASFANFNITDLENDLNSSDITVLAKHGSDTEIIQVNAALTWTSSHILTLQASQYVAINAPLFVAGAGSLTLGYGSNFFGPKGHISFRYLSDKLVIQGRLYRLVRDIAGLQADLNVDPYGWYALARNYDASADGTYTRSPIDVFQGTLEGLGNKISNLTISSDSANYCCQLGFFGQIASGGTVQNLVLKDVHVAYTTTSGGAVGMLAGENQGDVEGCYANGSLHVTPVTGQSSYPLTAVGGLVGLNDAAVKNSEASVTVRSNVRDAYIGGLVGEDMGVVEDTFATGSVTGGTASIVGGLIGLQGNSNGGLVATSYSSGAVSGPGSATVGGLVGYRVSLVLSSYWDITTSGTTQSAGGTGLTNAQLQSGLPSGFSPTTWTQNAAAYNGLPYLRYVPR